MLYTTTFQGQHNFTKKTNSDKKAKGGQFVIDVDFKF